MPSWIGSKLKPPHFMLLSLLQFLLLQQRTIEGAADAHADHYMLTQVDAVKRSQDAAQSPTPRPPPPVLPYLSSMPLALAFYDVELNHMPIVNVTTRHVSLPTHPRRGFFWLTRGHSCGGIPATPTREDRRTPAVSSRFGSKLPHLC